MEPRRPCPFRTPSNEQGWVIALVLMIMAVTMGLTLASACLVSFHMKTSTAFLRAVQGSLLSTSDGRTFTSSETPLPAPEGWDHIHFSTMLTDQGVHDVRSYSWRAALRVPCDTIPGHAPVPSGSPHVVAIIDDSMAMNLSSGHEYGDDDLYLNRAAGGIVHVSSCCEIADTWTSAAGTYFRGRWGASAMRAPSSNGLHGSMPVWTHAFSKAREILDSLDHSEIAVMSTSRRVIMPFSHDGNVIVQALDAILPDSPDAPLSEALYHASGLFPGECASSRHILLVTAGVPVNDGHLPAWLRDYDGDGNPADTAFPGQGSHCLDDAAAYAASLGIRVHVMGPDLPFLRDVAAQGGGRFMPARDELAPRGVTVTAPVVMHRGMPLLLSNTGACLDPPWLATDAGRHVRAGVTSPLDMVACPDISITGTARSHACDASVLYCTTSRDRLVAIDTAGGELTWLYQGVGGPVFTRGGFIVAGPGRQGLVSILSRQGALRWQQRGTCADASESLAYIGTGSLIQAHTLDDGYPVASHDAIHKITVIRYDPVSGTVLAGTSAGTLHLFSQGLEPAGTLSTGGSEPILEVRTLTLRRTFHILVLDRQRLTAFSRDGPVWSTPLDAGDPAGMTVMAGHVFVAAWNGEAPCRGMDSGVSSLLEIDASSGDLIRTEILGAGAFYGPCVDLEGASMRFVSWSGWVHAVDISCLPGILPCPLGKRITRQPE